MAVKKTECLAGMDNHDFSAFRNTLQTFGGSDASVIAGMNPYKSRYRLFMEKTGAITPPDISDRESVRLGHDLEQYVADRWMEATGKKCRNINYILQNDRFPFAHASLDRVVTGEKAFLECKTSSVYDTVRQCKKGVPEKYYCQLIHYLMVGEYDTAYLSVLCFGAGAFFFELHREDVEAEIEALAQMEAEFWENIQSGTPPEIDGSDSSTDALQLINAESVPGSCIDLSPLASSIEAFCKLKEQIDELKTEMQGYQNTICEYMGENETGIYNGHQITWKPVVRKTVDYKRFEADNPGCFADYQKTTTSRTFRHSQKKAK